MLLGWKLVMKLVFVCAKNRKFKFMYISAI